MTTFQVSDMTCGHCASAIARAIASVDSHARLDIRVEQKRVRVSSTATAAELAEAIQDAGYTPRQVRDDVQAPVPSQTSGCGCGCGNAPQGQPDRPAAPRRTSCCG